MHYIRYDIGMELSERCIKILEKEGFPSVHEWQDKPNTIYSSHQHQGRVTIFITEGSLKLTIEGVTHTLRTGDRFDIPPQTEHSAVVGPEGCQYVVGEMIEGDS